MHYYAFISYSHEDLKQVRKFHKKLEAFSVPAIIRRQIRSCPRNIYPVFRDETDLVAGVLTPKILDALAQSDYLIVICTKNSAASDWVSKEINAFLEHHSADHIIPVFLDHQTEKEYAKNFPGMLAKLNDSRDNCVLCRSGQQKKCYFEIAARILHCYSTQLLKRYSSRDDFVQILQVVGCFLMTMILIIDVIWMYKEDHPITKYCRDIDFSYDWPEAVEPLNVVSKLFAQDYYICTYHKNRIVRAERVSSGRAQTALPGQFLLEAACMEFEYNNFWESKAQVSRVVFRDENDQVIYVKNFSLDHYIVDLTCSADSSEPFYLPADTTCSILPAETAQQDSPSGCRIAQIYDNAGQISQIWFVSDTFSYHTCDQNGYFGIAFSYDDSGEPVRAQYLDLDGSVLMTYEIPEDPQ